MAKSNGFSFRLKVYRTFQLFLVFSVNAKSQSLIPIRIRRFWSTALFFCCVCEDILQILVMVTLLGRAGLGWGVFVCSFLFIPGKKKYFSCIIRFPRTCKLLWGYRAELFKKTTVDGSGTCVARTPCVCLFFPFYSRPKKKYFSCIIRFPRTYKILGGYRAELLKKRLSMAPAHLCSGRTPCVFVYI